MNILPISNWIYKLIGGVNEKYSKNSVTGYIMRYSIRQYFAALFTITLWIILLFTISTICVVNSYYWLIMFSMINIILNLCTEEIQEKAIKKQWKALSESFLHKDLGELHHGRLSIIPIMLFILTWIINLLLHPYWLLNGRPFSDIWTITSCFIILFSYFNPLNISFNILQVIILILLLNMLSYLFRMIFADEPSSANANPLQDTGRSLFLFGINYLEVLLVFACLYKWHFDKVVASPFLFSMYNIVPFGLSPDQFIINKINNLPKITLWNLYLPLTETLISMFLLLFVLVKFIIPFNKNNDIKKPAKKVGKRDKER